MALTGEAMPTKAADAGATACRHALRVLLLAGAGLAAYLLFGMFDRAAYADTAGTVLDPLSPVVSAIQELPIVGTAPGADAATAPITTPVRVAPAAPSAAGTAVGDGRAGAQGGNAVRRTRPAGHPTAPAAAAAPRPIQRQVRPPAGEVLSSVTGLAAPVAGAVPAVLDSARATVNAPVSQVLPQLTSAVNKALGSAVDDGLASAGDLVTRGVGGLPSPPVPALPQPGQLPPPLPPSGGPADPLPPADVLPHVPDATNAAPAPPGAVPAQRLRGAPSLSQVPTSWQTTVTVPVPGDPRAGAARPSMPDGSPLPNRTTHDAGSAGAQRSGGDNIPTAATIAVPWHPVLLARGDGTLSRSACSGRLVHHGRLPG
jgi:hypothetical protein